MADETAEALREMAQHRGLKLVRSRRRKPGTGDFGKFGLTDAAGKALIGIGKDGLTASAADIEAYLRAGAASTWQQSAKITRGRAKPRSDSQRDDAAAEASSRRERAGGALDDDGAAKSSRGAAPRRPRNAGRKAAATASQAKPRHAANPARDAVSRSAPAREELAASVQQTPKPEPSLVLRAARPADAAALAALLRQLSGISASKDRVTRQLAALRKTGAGVHVAEFGELVGCIAWSVVPTLQRGPVGRITVLVVDEEHRRRGIATRLLAEAEAALAKTGCTLVEAMSDIEIKNSHNFFRAAKFAQASYRFVRKIAR